MQVKIDNKDVKAAIRKMEKQNTKSEVKKSLEEQKEYLRKLKEIKRRQVQSVKSR